ncbi:MAG: TolC family protein [Verrucomicrobia bacterium]|nr:TolC family protein [Verrucomicrobiota bacterium]
MRLFVFAFAAAFAAHAAPPASRPSNALTLDDAIRLALANNQRVKVSAFDPDIARANLLAEYGRFDPALTFRRSHSENEFPVATSPLVTQLTQTDDYSLSLDGATPWGLTYSLGAIANHERGTFNRFSDSFITFGGVSITQPLLRGFGFGASLAGVRVAKANRGISDWQHRQTVIDTVTSVILAYNNLVQARDNLRIARLSRELAAQLLSDNEKRNRIGSLSDADVIQARARVANREESILFAERGARDIENQLRLLIGETAFANTGAPIEITPLPPAAEPAVNPADDLKRAYDLRPDYQAARLGVTIQRTNSALAQNQLLPRVDFVGSYGYNGSDRDFAASRAQVRNEDNRAYSAGVVVRVPLAFAEGRGRARAARLGLRQTEADLSRIERDIAVAVSAAAGQIETTGQRVAATRSAYELAQQALDAEQKRFRAGTSTTFFVLQLQEQLSAVESGYYRALADQRRALANYQRELGTTLANHNIKLE